MALVKCVFCDVVNDALKTSGYCDACGKKLPSSALIKTRRSLTSDSTDGPEVTRSALPPTMEALLVAAVVHLVVGGMFLIIGPAMVQPVPEYFMSLVMTWALVPCLFLGMLGGLARWQPRPAAILALVLSVGWIALTFFLDYRIALPWLLVQVILLALVGRAVNIGFRSPAR